MYYTYVLKGKSNPSFYIGYSSDLRRRVAEHNAGNNISTKRGRPWVVVYYEAYLSEHAARKRESRLKQRGKAWQEVKRRINDNNV